MRASQIGSLFLEPLTMASNCITLTEREIAWVLADFDLQRQVREGAWEIEWADRRYRRREGWGNQALYPAQELRTIK